MSAVAQLIDVDALIPDGIEPVEALRCWHILDGKLASITTGEVWTPGEPLTARCTAGNGVTYSWNIVRRGMSRERALERATSHNQNQTMLWMPGVRSSAPTWIPSPTTVALPDGYGFELVEETHDAPSEGCTCGIYAASKAKQLPDGGHVYGKVKLWGKVVPGERGVRAQFAYPSEFHVHAALLNDPMLKAFGVPIIATDGMKIPVQVGSLGGLAQFISPPTATRSTPRKSHAMRWAIAANFAACALNLSLAGLRVFH